MPSAFDPLASALFTLLRDFDRQAVRRHDGKPTGLNWYGGYRTPEGKRPITEPLWSKELALGLTASGIPAASEVAYPSAPRERCDLVVGGRTWIEVKGAWKAYWGKSDHLYRSYLLHPLVPDLDPKTHTAALDIVKVGRLTKEHADAVGLLLIGFEHVDRPMDPEIEILVAEGKLGTWGMAETSWLDAQREGERVRCWLWMRNVES